MHLTPTPFPDLKLITLKLHHDDRGFFVERFNNSQFAALNLPTNFVQDNHSFSHPNVIRGLHAQHTPAQGKLVGAISGAIWDVAVDIRPTSPTLGQHFAVELSALNGQLLYIPPGFAHGFCVLGNQPANVLYKTTALYNPKGEHGIIYNDPTLAINWPIKAPKISPKDESLPTFQEYLKNPPNWKM